MTEQASATQPTPGIDRAALPVVQEDGAAGGRPSLSVIFVQYDRKKYPQALERLIVQLQRLQSVAITVVVVDNFMTETPATEVASRIIHVGGDNTAWEFSGFDKGVELLKSWQKRTDLYAFVTDAFTAYGDGFLELVDDHVIDFVLKTGSCVGWVDSIMQEYRIFEYSQNCHLRSSFIFMPGSAHAALSPLTYPINRDEIFSTAPARPFVDNNELSNNLKAFITAWLTNNIETDYKLEELWHSRFTLDETTFEYFKMKTLAILREHLLSARMIKKGIPCYDLRLVRLFVENWIEFDSLNSEEQKEFQWLGWRQAESRKKFFHLDWVKIPEKIQHGDSVDLEVSGWIKTKPQVDEVAFSLSERRFYTSDCSIERSDGLPGFEIRANLGSLQPGAYAATWLVPEKSIRKELGTMEVLPRYDLKIIKRLVSDIIYSDKRWPVYLEASFITSEELAKVWVLLDGDKQDIHPDVMMVEKTSSGLTTYRITVSDMLVVKDLHEQYMIELVAFAASGRKRSHRHYCSARYESTTPHVLSVNRIEKYNHDSRSTRVLLRGSIYAAAEIEGLILLRDREPVCELHPARAGGKGTWPAWLDFELNHEVPGIPPGDWAFQLELLKSWGDPREILVEWRQVVQAEKPIVHVDRIEVESLEAPSSGDRSLSSYLLSLVGWVENDHLINFLQIKLDGEVAHTSGLDKLRPKASRSSRDGLLRHQGFQLAIPIQTTPGEHRVEIVAKWADLAAGSWGANLIFTEPQYSNFTIISPDLERMRSSQRTPFWFSIKLGGRIESSLDELLLKLFVNHQLVDQQLLAQDGEFNLRHVPEATGTVAVRMTVESHRREIFDSGNIENPFIKAALPERAEVAFERALQFFSIPLESFAPASSEEVLLMILEDDEALSSKLDLLASLETRWNEPPRPVFLAAGAAAEIAEPMKILFVSWDVPCWKHSAGAPMASLLRELGKRHVITVLHTYDPEQATWADEIRPFVSRIVSIPRMSLEARANKTLDGFSPNGEYLSELKRAIERELHSSSFDLVHYEQAAMCQYVSSGPTPRALAIHGLPFEQHCSTLLKPGQPRGQLIEHLRSLLGDLYFIARTLAQASEQLIVTQETDGQVLARIAPKAHVSLNAPGIEEEPFELEDGSGELRSAATFVCSLGRRRSERAEVLGLLQKIFPIVRSRHAEARLVILGEGLPRELQGTALEDVEFVDARSDLRPHLRSATGFLALASAEPGRYHAALEAMACGCPVISTRPGARGCRAEAGRHYLEANNAGELADAICRCIENHDLRQDLAEAARRLVEEKHSWRQRAREREEIWRRAIASTSRNQDHGTKLKNLDEKRVDRPRRASQVPDQHLPSPSRAEQEALTSQQKTA